MKTVTKLAVAGACAALATGIQPGTVSARTNTISVAGDGVTISATGGGHYFLQNAFDTQFAFSAVQKENGEASGMFHQSLDSDTGTVDFRAAVTCMAVDSDLHRAWIGGVIVANNSTDPAFNQPIHQPGHDIWFRVLDNGQGQDPVDRTTFMGFEGVIPSSASYCEQRIWPDGNARTWPVTEGNLSVRP